MLERHGKKSVMCSAHIRIRRRPVAAGLFTLLVMNGQQLDDIVSETAVRRSLLSYPVWVRGYSPLAIGFTPV